MREINEIESKFPILFDLLGDEYIEKLKLEQGALSRKATINPLFEILYMNNKFDLESLIRKALDNKAIDKERLKRFKNEKDNVNIQNFINELHMLEPMYSYGNFLLEDNENSTPDFCATINGKNIAFECVSVNEHRDCTKQKNLDNVKINKDIKFFFKNNPNKNIFSAFNEYKPFGTTEILKIIKKIRDVKSSKQTKSYPYKILMMSFKNMSFLCQPKECLPYTGNLYDGIHSGFIYPAFYGKRGDLIYETNSFEGEEHTISLLDSDGKFSRDSDFNLCIFHFETQKNEEYKQYVFFENLKNPLPADLINQLSDIFYPYKTYSVLKKFFHS